MWGFLKCFSICYNVLCVYSAAWKFVNPLEISIFLHKYDPKHNQIFEQALKVDKENPLFIQENDPILHICEWQKYVNLLD